MQATEHGGFSKEIGFTNHDAHELASDHGLVASRWQGTTEDKRDMRQLGRTQELRRNFKFVSILSFGATLVASWEVIITTLTTSLTDGGTAGLLWGYIATVIGFAFVYLSLSELASISPTSGGQYHWISEFAPRSAQKFLSYLVGWLCFTGWQAAITSITYLAGTVIQGLIILNDDSYVPKPWHGTLLIIAITAFAILFNTILARQLPVAEATLLVLHILGGLAIIITLWKLAPIANAGDVWFQFTNAGGWSSDGASTMVGLLSPVISTLGYDSVVHMAEEVRDSSYTLPRALLSSFGFNAALGFVMAVTLCFTLGNVDDILASKTGFPFIQIILNVTGSYAATNILSIVVVLTLVASTIAEVATASRQLWSFARDGGFPGHRWIAQVTPGWDVPLNAVFISLLVTSLLSLINIGSSAALNAILALTTVSTLTSYTIVIVCVLIRRFRGQSLPKSRFSLGRWGAVINILAICFLLPVFVFMFFPAVVSPTPQTMNWAIVMYVGIMSFATAYYFVWGRRDYVAPVALVKRDDDDD